MMTAKEARALGWPIPENTADDFPIAGRYTDITGKVWMTEGERALASERGVTVPEYVPGYGPSVVPASTPVSTIAPGVQADGVAEYYGDALYSSTLSPTQPGLQPAGLGEILIKSAFLISLFGKGIIRLLRPLGRFVGGKLMVAWGRLPSWVRAGLVAVGFTAGTDLVIDGVTDEDQYPMITDGGTMLPTVIGSWVANGRTFYRLSDGRLATQKNDGRWTIWRPKKPVVIYATGQKNMEALLKADAIVAKHSGRMAKTLRRRGYVVRRKTEKKGS